MTKPVYRHLVEKRWREEGALDLLVRCIFLYDLNLLLSTPFLDGTYSPNESRAGRSS